MTTAELPDYTPEEVLAMQWTEFETEAEALTRMLSFLGTEGEAIMADLKELWATRGGPTKEYEEHQELLNGLIAQALAIETPFGLPRS